MTIRSRHWNTSVSSLINNTSVSWLINNLSFDTLSSLQVSLVFQTPLFQTPLTLWSFCLSSLTVYACGRAEGAHSVSLPFMLPCHSCGMSPSHPYRNADVWIGIYMQRCRCMYCVSCFVSCLLSALFSVDISFLCRCLFLYRCLLCIHLSRICR